MQRGALWCTAWVAGRRDTSPSSQMKHGKFGIRSPLGACTASLPLILHIFGFTRTVKPVKVNLFYCLFVFSLSEHTVKRPYVCSMDLLDCSVLNIKCKYGPYKVEIFHGMCENMVDRLEKLLVSQGNTIHAETSRYPLLNKVLSWSVMCSCELPHYLSGLVLTWPWWLLTPLLAQLLFVRILVCDYNQLFVFVWELGAAAWHPRVPHMLPLCICTKSPSCWGRRTCFGDAMCAHHASTASARKEKTPLWISLNI